MVVARNIAIIAVLALGVAVAPGGGAAAEVVLAVLILGFLATVGFFTYRLFMENRLTISTLSDSRRAALYGAVGLIALLIAGADELFDSGAGTLAWIGLLGLAVFAIIAIWSEANRYV